MTQDGNKEMGNAEETPDWAKAEITAAVEILKSDGLHIHKTYEQFMAGKEQTPPKDEPTEGQPPPAKDNPTPTPEKKSVWWGDRK
jgi:hypothetical protein